MENTYADLDGTQRMYDVASSANAPRQTIPPPVPSFRGMAPPPVPPLGNSVHQPEYASPDVQDSFPSSRLYMAPQTDTYDEIYQSADVQDSFGFSAAQLPKNIEKTIKPTLTQHMVESLLQQNGMSDGLYALRCSTSNPGCYVLCVAWGGVVKKYPIDKCTYPQEGKFTLLCPGERRIFDNIADIIFYYTQEKGGIATRLTRRVD